MSYDGQISISIIVPYYNSGAYIGNILEDLLHQDISTDEYEIIVVDDGSTENVDILRSYCANYNCIRYILINHTSLSIARNVGLEAAHGDYIFFCDSDERVKRNVLGHLCKIAARYNLEVLLFNRLIIRDKEKLSDSKFCKDLCTPITSGDTYFANHTGISGGTWAYIIKRGFLKEMNLHFSYDVIICEDILFLMSLLLAAKQVSYIDTDVSYYIQRPGSIIYETGMNCKAQKAADYRLQYIQYLDRVLNDQELLCRENIKMEKYLTTFIAVHNAFRYLSISQNWHILRELRDMGAYPLREQIHVNRFYRFVQWTMNHSVLWMTCCVLFHIIPGSLRKKF